MNEAGTSSIFKREFVVLLHPHQTRYANEWRQQLARTPSLNATRGQEVVFGLVHTLVGRDTRTRVGGGVGTTLSNAMRTRGQCGAHGRLTSNVIHEREGIRLARPHRTRYVNERGYGWHNLIERNMRTRVSGWR